MKSMKDKENLTKVEAIDKLKNVRKTNKILILLLVIFFLGTLYYGYLYNVNKYNLDDVPTNSTSQDEGDELTNNISEYVTGYINGLLSLDYPWLAKLLIFLGGLYIVQVAFSITGDLVQVLLVLIMGMYRLGKWVYCKITGKPYNKKLKYVNI